MPRPKLPPRLIERPNREHWYIRDGGQSLSTFTSNRREAEKCLAQYIAALNAPPSDPTIDELLEWRLREVRSRKLARASRVTPYYHKPLSAFFGAFRPSEVTPELVAQYVERRQAQGVKARHELIELKVALNAAVKRGVIERAPSFPTPAEGQPRDRFISKAEYTQLLSTEMPAHIFLFILIAGTTGARKGAILDLTWDRVDIDRRRIDFNHPDKAPNNKRRTIVPISRDVANMLQRAKDMAESDHVIEYCGRPVLDIKKGFANAVKSAGLSGVSPHVLKHSAISWLAEARHSVDEIADMTGTSRKTIWRVYRKFSPEYLEPMASSLGSGLEHIESRVLKPFGMKKTQNGRSPKVSLGASVVEPSGIEPLTSTMPL